MRKTRDFAFELKAINEDGTFEGYGSVFGVKDSYDEVVEKGAFVDSLDHHKSKASMPALLWQHKGSEPIGVYTSMEEDSVGLKVSGQLAMKTTRGREAYELLKMKALGGLSIGFVSREDSYDQATGIRSLKKVDLWEVSLVTFPANDAARVQSVKSIEKLETIRDAEGYLRDSGLSRTEARAFIACVKGLGQRDAEGDELQKLAEAINRRGQALA